MSADPISNFKLDTSKINLLIESSKSLAEKMRDLSQMLDTEKNNLVSMWVGKGSNSFQKKYHQLSRQLTDLKDDLFDISEKALSDYEAYMQWDIDNSKYGVESTGTAGGK